MIDAVLFDLDGTLADTAADLGAVLNRLLIEAERPSLPLARIRPHVSKGVRGLLGIGFQLTPDDPAFAALRERFLADYGENLCRETRLFEGIDALLGQLEASAIPWGVVTNKTSHYAQPLIEALDLAQRAACLVSGDSTPNPKPCPDPLLLASELIGRPPARCLYIGDDPRDIEAARRAGMGAVAAAWGYLGDELPIENWQADHIIHSPGEVTGLLGKP